MSILFVKNLSGSFNNQNIGHEVINSYCDDNDDVYFYIPPYGCIGTKKKTFFESDEYKNIDAILVFDDVNITNVYKLKQVILHPIKFNSFDEMKSCANGVLYAGRPIKDIDFGDQSFIESNNKEALVSDLKNEDMKVYLLSYKLDKNHVYDFESDNKFIYVKSSERRNNLKEKSMNLFGMIYGETATIDDVDIIIGQEQYAYKNMANLNSWFETNIKSLCTDNKRMNFPRVPHEFESNYSYDDNNFLSFVRKTNDENYYSNYIGGILNRNTDLLNGFFAYLINMIYGVSDYAPSNVKCLLQTQSMTEDMKIINKIIKFRRNHLPEETMHECEKKIKKLKKKHQYTDEKINEYISSSLNNNQLLFIDGQIDIYLFDDTYRIVIENKILSGLHGKHDDISKDINQLITYNKYLNHLNERAQKINKVIILCPYCLKNDFANYKIDGDIVPILTYRDLVDFFGENRDLILEVYRDDFIKTINRQALTKNELITYRFIKTVNS